MRFLIILLATVSLLMGGNDSQTLAIIENPNLGTVELEDSTITYTHTGPQLHPDTVALDSFKVEATDEAGHTDNNHSFVLVIPKHNNNPFEIELFALNSPLSINGQDVTEITTPDFDNNFDMSVFPKGNHGIALIVTMTRSLDIGYGEMVVFDAVGNAVTDKISFQWDYKNYVDGEFRIAGVAMWDGTNKNGRTVGSGSYLAIIDINVKGQPVEADSLVFPQGFEEYQDSIPHRGDRSEFSGSFRKVVGVRKK